MEDIIDKDAIWKIYETLPNSLKEAIFSEDTSDIIWNIAKIYNISEIPKLARVVGDVLSGLLPPEDFRETIEAELKIDEDTAKKIEMQIEHLIFNPVKEDLDKLYHPEKTKIEEEKPERKEDIYREPIE